MGYITFALLFLIWACLFIFNYNKKSYIFVFMLRPSHTESEMNKSG